MKNSAWHLHGSARICCHSPKPGCETESAILFQPRFACGNKPYDGLSLFGPSGSRKYLNAADTEDHERQERAHRRCATSWPTIRQRPCWRLCMRGRWPRSIRERRARALRSRRKARGFQGMHPALTKAWPRRRPPSVMRHGASAFRASRKPSGRSSMGFRTVSAWPCLRIACR